MRCDVSFALPASSSSVAGARHRSTGRAYSQTSTQGRGSVLRRASFRGSVNKMRTYRRAARSSVGHAREGCRAGDEGVRAEAGPADKDYSDAISSWPELAQMHSLAYAMNNSIGDLDASHRLGAAHELGPMTTYDTVTSLNAVERYTQQLAGSLWDASTIIDNHYRILKDCLIQDNYTLVEDVYHGLAHVPPVMSPREIDGLVDVASKALIYIRDDHDMVASMLEGAMDEGDSDLGFEAEQEMRKDYYKAKAMLHGIDSLLARLPEPSTVPQA